MVEQNDGQSNVVAVKLSSYLHTTGSSTVCLKPHQDAGVTSLAIRLRFEKDIYAKDTFMLQTGHVTVSQG